MLSADQQRLIEQATVTLTGLTGRGILIPGQMILTAAHCVTYTTDGSMVLGDFFLEDILTAQGMALKAQPVFLDPLADIALLGALDSQEFSKEVSHYEAWCEAILPIPLSEADFPFDSPIPISVYTHRGQWIRGTVCQMSYDANALAWIMTTQIEGGTSGSPIVTDDGLIVGVVSHTNETGAECMGLTPRPHLTLPGWALRQIAAHNDDEGAYAAARMAWYGIAAATPEHQ